MDAQPTRDELAERQAIQSSIAGIEAARLTENRSGQGRRLRLNRLLAQLTAPFDATLLVQASEDVEATKGALMRADRLLTQGQQAHSRRSLIPQADWPRRNPDRRGTRQGHAYRDRSRCGQCSPKRSAMRDRRAVDR
ncbi:MAG: hypothetical protein IPI02_18570 [Sterolibacteriaceae bacterium]|nr:hypothetical protein [Sterolibacteriaceae bacterium]